MSNFALRAGGGGVELSLKAPSLGVSTLFNFRASSLLAIAQIPSYGCVTTTWH